MNYLRISCLVPDDGNLWSLLRDLVDHKARDVEVQPALPVAAAAKPADPVKLIGRHPPKRRPYVRRYATISPEVKANLLAKLAKPTTIRDLAAATGLPNKTIANALDKWRKEKQVVRLEHGVYQRAPNLDKAA